MAQRIDGKAVAASVRERVRQETEALIAEKKETVEDFAAQLSKAKAKAGEYKNQISQQSESLKKLNNDLTIMYGNSYTEVLEKFNVIFILGQKALQNK